MPLNLEKIEKTITSMDRTYDANFGEWIRNEENCKIIAYHLKKYIVDYPAHDFVVVLKWIVKDWTLRSIIILTKMMIITDLEESFERKMDILQGLIFTWNPVFIAEFVVSVSRMLNSTMKKTFVLRLFEEFEKERIKLVVEQMGNKIEEGIKALLVRSMSSGQRKKRSVKRKRLLEAYNIL
ncbi:hypothetical protein THOM_0341 [Trachipleistophora hominis]|uniref:Uncharacterized protein n=1 Tax=Trachipleistophora hominis TaxID=72359 RepID=L7JZ74_TRAHO|nr:hypothetical protein THOM_0341 [Trachipleistophora hominis]